MPLERVERKRRSRISRPCELRVSGNDNVCVNSTACLCANVCISPPGIQICALELGSAATRQWLIRPSCDNTDFALRPMAIICIKMPLNPRMRYDRRCIDMENVIGSIEASIEK